MTGTSQQEADAMLQAFWKRRAVIRSLKKQWAPLPYANLHGGLVRRTGRGIMFKI